MPKPNKALTALLVEANSAYPDEIISTAFDLERGYEYPDADKGGDTLGLFIGREITSVFDSTLSAKANREAVVSALFHAQRQIGDVVAALLKRGA